MHQRGVDLRSERPQTKKCKYLQKNVDSVLGMLFTEFAGGD